MVSDAGGGYHLEIDPAPSAVSMREIAICIDGDPLWFAQIAMGIPYKKDGDGKPYIPPPPPDVP